MANDSWLKSYWAAVLVWWIVAILVSGAASLIFLHGDTLVATRLPWEALGRLALLSLAGGGICRGVAQQWKGAAGILLSGLCGMLCVFVLAYVRLTAMGIRPDHAVRTVDGILVVAQFCIGALAGLVIGWLNAE